jgi:hypothetical protein
MHVGDRGLRQCGGSLGMGETEAVASATGMARAWRAISVELAKTRIPFSFV